MRKVAVIPARWASTRFKGKVLADINGKPMLQHVWERVSRSRQIDDVFIAVDKEKVQKVAESFGAKVIMTPPELSSGTDRIAAAASSIDADIFVNVQADEPLVDEMMIDELASVYDYEKNVQMATLITRMHDGESINDPNIVKCVVDRKCFALYFSRSAIPYVGGEDINSSYFKHIGMYSYTRDFLFTFASLPASTLESEEKLEQLRALEHGYKIKAIEIPYGTVGVDTEEDLDKVCLMLEEGEQQVKS